MKAAARQIRDAQVAEVYAGNQSLRTTAKLFGLSHEGVRKILTAQGVEIAPPCTWSISVVAPPRCNVERPVSVSLSAHRATLPSPLVSSPLPASSAPAGPHTVPAGASYA